MDAGLTRRGLVRAGLAAAVVVPFGVAGRASAATGPARLTLPAPPSLIPGCCTPVPIWTVWRPR